MICSKLRVNKVAESYDQKRWNNSHSIVFFAMPFILPLSSKVGWMKRLYMVQSLRGESIFNSVKGVCIGERELTFTGSFLCVSLLY